MALRALMLKKRLDDKRKALEDLKTVDFAQREAELEKAIEDLYQAELGVMTGKIDEDLAFNLFLANFSL